MSTTDLRPYPTLAPQPAPAAPMRRRPALPHGHVHWAAVVVATGALVVLGAGIARTFASSPAHAPTIEAPANLFESPPFADATPSAALTAAGVGENPPFADATPSAALTAADVGENPPLADATPSAALTAAGVGENPPFAEAQGG